MTMMPALSITPLSQAYLRQKAEVHALTWRETYHGLLPQSLIVLVTPDFALRSTLAHPMETTYLALLDDAVIGFADFADPARPPIAHPNCSEITSLYVLAEYQGRGVGRALFETTISHTAHPNRVALWAFLCNARAIGFYEHCGFHTTGKTQTEDDGRNPEIELANFDTDGA